METQNKPTVTDIDRPILVPPGGHKKVLLHSCCAPCSGEVMEAMLASGIDYTIYFYNPNIHPHKEYMLRKEENVRFAEKFGIPFIDKDDDYENDRKEWFAKAKGMEFEPERGIRCTMCFDMRFEKAAQYAHEHGFPVFTSSLGISRWKNMNQINDCGRRAAAPYDDVVYWDFNWRRGGGSARMIEISKRENFYQQEYCGCAYSLRDSNAHRKSGGRAMRCTTLTSSAHKSVCTSWHTRRFWKIPPAGTHAISRLIPKTDMENIMSKTLIIPTES